MPGELDAFPTEFTSPLPDFNSAGLLEPGDYAPSQIEFEERFVNLGDTARRKFIYEGWNRHRTALLEAGVPKTARQLLNGSFTTTKPTPGDIDIAVEVPVANIDLMETHPAKELLAGPDMKPEFQCDAYAIFVLPSDDPYYEAVTVEGIKYWTDLFGKTRKKSPKGRVWATTGGLP